MAEILLYKLYEKPTMKADSVTGISYSDSMKLHKGYGTVRIESKEELNRIWDMIENMGGKVIGVSNENAGMNKKIST